MSIRANYAEGVRYFQSRVGACDNPGICKWEFAINPERVRQPPNPFRVSSLFLDSYPGLSQAPTLGSANGISPLTLKGFANRRTLSGFHRYFWIHTQGCRKLQPWAGISEHLRR